MVDSLKIEKAVGRVRNQASFIQELLVDALEWPIADDVASLEEIAYLWTEDELGAIGLGEKVVGGSAYQIVLPDNPWGIFILEFENPDVLVTGRGMTGVLRRVLQGLVIKKRGSRDSRLAAFKRENLLFICSHDYERYRFAHFKAPIDGSATASMSSFGWGPEDVQALRTICEYNLSSLAWPETTLSSEESWISHWTTAFDVEAVTRRFYGDYASVFGQVEDLIGSASQLVGDELRMSTQSLFNRLMFLRFVERKGWLEFPGQASNRYLAALSDSGGVNGESLYLSRLRPLFFEGLSQEGSQQDDRYGRVSLVNGGLFEESPLDAKLSDIPDQALARVMGPDGLFYRYNFTVEESTPLDVEVAVDPEMLGRVFEELVTGRHESGSFYTPRPIVSFMCREVLKTYLAESSSASEASLERLIDDHLVEGLSERHASEIADALDRVRVVDPACGSGAYLLGLLQVMVEIRRTLQSERLAADPQFLYNLKLSIISRCLYGVDIDPFATEIAKLRLWLSLAVEADHPVPMPNLDFKIERGDSLLGPDPRDYPDLFKQHAYELSDNLFALKDDYLEATGSRKGALKREIEAVEQELASEMQAALDWSHFEWRVQFAEVFGKSRGFDIVLANPPYVSALEFTRTRSKEERDAIRKRFSTASGAWDLYVPFFQRGIQLLREGGVLAYVSPNKYLSASYAEGLRSFIRQNTTFMQLVDLSRFTVFQSAAVYPVLTFLHVHAENSPPDSSSILISRLPSTNHADADPKLFRQVDVEQSALDLLPGLLWGFLLSDNLALLSSLVEDTSTLASVADVSATTTAGEAETYGGSLKENDDASDFRVVNTGTIDPYVSKWGLVGMTNAGTKWTRPTLEARNVSEGRRTLYATPKVMIAKMAKRCEAFIDKEGTYAGLNINCVRNPKEGLSLEFLCGYLNSSVFMFLYDQLFGALRMSGGYYQFQAPQLKAMPVPLVSAQVRASIDARVRRVHEIAAQEGMTKPALELVSELDEIFAQLFGITLSDLPDPH